MLRDFFVGAHCVDIETWNSVEQKVTKFLRYHTKHVFLQPATTLKHCVVAQIVTVGATCVLQALLQLPSMANDPCVGMYCMQHCMQVLEWYRVPLSIHISFSASNRSSTFQQPALLEVVQREEGRSR